MHEPEPIQKMIHSLSMQLSEFEQVYNLDEVEHVQDDSVGLLG